MALITACATSPAEQSSSSATTLLDLCGRTEQQGGVDANHCYEQWLLDYPSDDAAQSVRYATAARWIALGRPQRATTLLDEMLERDPEHPMAQALRSTLPKTPLYLEGVDFGAPKRTTPKTPTAKVTATTSEPLKKARTSSPTKVEKPKRTRKSLQAGDGNKHPKKDAAPIRSPESPTTQATPTSAEATPRHEPEIRMLIASGASIDVAFYRSGRFTDGGRVTKLPAGKTTTLRSSSHNGRSDCGQQPCKFSVGALLFDGQLQYVRQGRGHHWVVAMPLERYLRGVVPSEMPSGWPIAALQAQAVISRTYALRLIEANPDAPFHLGTTVAHQAYNATSRSSGVERAIQETRGQVLMRDDAPIIAYFSADNGGLAESASNVWGNQPEDYLVGKDRWSDQVPHWSFAMSRDEVTTMLRRKFLRGDEQIERMRFFRNSNDRVNRVEVTTNRRTVDVSGNDFRLMLGSTKLKSLLFDMKVVSGRYVFEGRGYGHGVGLSQWGARAMAQAGKSYQEILSHYYPRPTLNKLW